MADITSIGYNNSWAWNTEFGLQNGYVVIAEQAPPSTYLMNDVSLLQITPTSKYTSRSQAEQHEQTLLYLSNGVQLRLATWTDEREDATLYWYGFRLQGVDGTTLDRSEQYVNIPAGEGVGSYGLYSVYAPSSVMYNYDDVAGDSPLSISILGNLFISKNYDEQPLIGERPALIGELSQTDIIDWYVSVPITLGMANSQEQLDEILEMLNNAGNGKSIIPDPKDPNPIRPEDDPNTGGGGGGNYNKPTGGVGGDTIDFPALPSVSGITSGFVTMYNPNATQLRSLGNKLWSDDFIEAIKKIQNNPFEAIISLALLPFQPSVGGSVNCMVGNYNSEVSMPLVTNQYKTINCGSISITENWGSFLDYTPYTSVDIYLPFIGIKHLKTEDVMNKVLNISYNVDCLTGAGVCFVKCGKSVLYTYDCNVIALIPCTGSDFSNFIQSIIKSVGMTAGTIVAGATGNPLAMVGLGYGALTNISTSKQSTIERSGSLHSCVGQLGTFTPYAIIHRPIQALPSNMKGFKGYTSFITNTLGTLSGYTEVAYIHLDGVSATDTEKDEILKLLQNGVII